MTVTATPRAIAARPRHRTSSIYNGQSIDRISGWPDGIVLATVVIVAGTDRWSVVYAVAVWVVLHAAGVHRMPLWPRVSTELGPIAAAVTGPLPLLLLAPAGSPLPRVGLCAALLVASRAVGYPALAAVRRHGRLSAATIVVGTGTLGGDIARLLADHPEYGSRPIGFVDDLPPAAEFGLPLLGAPGDLPELVRRHGVRRVIVCFAAASDASLVPLLRSCRELPVRVWVVPRLYELGTRIPVRHRDEIWGVPLIPLRHNVIGPIGRRVKRLLDVLLTIAVLPVAVPVLAVSALALLLRHGRPVLFRQDRLTRDGGTVPVVKLRTLTDAHPDTNWAGPADPGSAIRRWLRATHLDELPQLLNVLRGEMSLVGPRPERPYFAARFAERIPGYADRHRGPAGITGWAQVHGLHGDTSIAERVRFDNAYLENWSWWTDLVILARTLATPLSGARTIQHADRRAR